MGMELAVNRSIIEAHNGRLLGQAKTSRAEQSLRGRSIRSNHD
jgi:hypothetical protein